MDGMRDPAKMQQRFAERQAELKQKLAITPDQETLWSQFTAAMAPPSTMPSRADMQALHALPIPERIDRVNALMNTRHAAMQARGNAVKALYAGLRPEQQRVLNDMRLPGMGGPGRMGHGERPHHG